MLGQVAEESILHEIEQFPSGVLLISLKTKPYGSVLKPLQYLDAKASPSTIKEKVTEFLALDYDKPPVVKVSKEVEDSENFDYATILTSIIREIDTTLRARRSRNETGFIRQSQVFQNFPSYLNDRVPNEWQSLGNRSLAIVVGAGPSLDETLPLLEASFPKPIIIATDSSLKALCDQASPPILWLTSILKNHFNHAVTQTTHQAMLFFPLNPTRVGPLNGKRKRLCYPDES